MATEPKTPANAAAVPGQTTGKTAAAGHKSSEAGLSAADQFTKKIAEMQLRLMPDMDAVTTVHRRNMETLSAANRVALEGAQAVARRNMEIMQQTMTELGEAVKAVASAEAPEEKAAKQVELLKQAYQHAVANMKELSDLIQKSNAEAAGLLNRRFSEGMDEVKALIEKFGEQRYGDTPGG
jgi:phasin family protein